MRILGKTWTDGYLDGRTFITNFFRTAGLAPDAPG